MEGIIAVIVAFVFICILFPRIVRHTTQFYASFGLVLLILLLVALAAMFESGGFSRFVTVVDSFLTIAALLLIVMATGGLSLKDLTGEFTKAIEVIRRGESDKEIIVPLTGEMPKPRRRPEASSEERVVHPIDAPVAPPAPERKGPDSSSIPLD
jgi:hypothetical protein